MSVEHVLPAVLHDGLVAGLAKPDSIVTKLKTGGRGARSFSDYELVTYSGKFLSWDYTEEELEGVRAFLRHIQVNVDPFWVVEPFAFSHDELVCGPLVDGVQTSVICPLREVSTIYSVMEDGVYTEAYTRHDYSNLVPDDDTANAVETVGDVTKWGHANTTVTRQVGLGVDGRACFKVDQYAQANNGLHIASLSVDSSQAYRVRASIRGTGTFNVKVVENDGGATATTSSNLTGTAADWSECYVDLTTTGTTTAIEVRVYRQEATAAIWFAGALGVHPGNFDQWFLPSACPGVFEFDSAPSANTRVTCGGKGKAVRRVAFDSASISWNLYTVGHAYSQGFSATEVLEF